MVDINLIGNEKSEPSQEKEQQMPEMESFGTEDFPSNDFGSLNSEEPGGFPPMDSNYVKKSPKTLMYILIGGCLVLLVLLILLLVSDSDKDGTDVADPGAGKTQTPAAVSETPKTQQPTLKTGLNSDKIANVSRLLSILPQNLKLSVLRYSHGNFIIESRSKTGDPISDFRIQFKQAFPAGSIKEANAERKRVRGSSFQQGVISGAVSEVSIWTRSEDLAQLNYISELEIQARIRSSCERSGLKLKKLDVGKGSAKDNYKMNLVKISAAGNSDMAIRFLQGLNDQKLNLNVSKIVLVASNFLSFNDENVNLFVDMELFNRM